MTDEAPRRRPVQREHELQRALRVFARDAIDLSSESYQFMAFDSAQKATDNQRARMISRGVVSGTPDCALFLKDAAPIWTEAKWGRGTLSDDQFRLLHKLQDLGHEIAVVRSVSNYHAQLVMCLVPLRPSAALIAADLDLKVAARIAKAEARVGSPVKSRPRKSAPRYTASKRLSRKMNLGGLG